MEQETFIEQFMTQFLATWAANSIQHAHTRKVWPTMTG